MNLEQFGQKIKSKYPQYQNIGDVELANKVMQKYPQYQKSITEVQDVKKEKETDTFMTRLKLGFGTKEERESRVEPKGFLKGGLAEIPRDIADVAGKALPLAGMVAGGIAGALGGPAGSVVGAGVGAGAGEMTRQTIGGYLGLQKAEPKEKIKEVGKEAVSGLFAELGGRAVMGAGKYALGALKKKIVKPAGEIIKDILKTTTGAPEKAISEIAEKPALAKIGFGEKISATTIRNEFANAFTKLKQETSKMFSKGIKEADEIYNIKPTDVFQVRGMKEEALRAVGFNLKNVISRFVENSKKFGIQFNSKNQITKIPHKLSGASGTAIKNAYSIIRKWKDFTPKGLQKLAEEIQSFRKFTAADLRTKSTPLIGRMIDDVSGFIRKFYPELGQTRTAYGVVKKILDNSDAILNVQKGKFDIKAMRSSVGKLTNLFKEDNDLYIGALRELEKRTGVNLLGKLAGTEFQKITPGLLRTSLALGGTAATSFNPTALFLLPIFSPRAVGGVITRAAQSKMLLTELFKISMGKEILDNGTKMIINRIIRGQFKD